MKKGIPSLCLLLACLLCCHGAPWAAPPLPQAGSLKGRTAPDNQTAAQAPAAILKALGLFLQRTDELHPGMAADNMSREFARLRPAGAASFPVAFLRVEKGLYIAAIGGPAPSGPSSLYLLDEGAPFLVATGASALMAPESFRYNGAELCAVVCKTPGALRPARDTFLLAREKGGWKALWSSEREQEWIADKLVRPMRDDWSSLRVEGTTAGIRTLDDPEFEKQVKDEPLRFYTAVWDRAGSAYVRRTNLSEAATIRDKVKEMEKPVMFGR